MCVLFEWENDKSKAGLKWPLATMDNILPSLHWLMWCNIPILITFRNPSFIHFHHHFWLHPCFARHNKNLQRKRIKYGWGARFRWIVKLTHNNNLLPSCHASSVLISFYLPSQSAQLFNYLPLFPRRKKNWFQNCGEVTGNDHFWHRSKNGSRASLKKDWKMLRQ